MLCEAAHRWSDHAACGRTPKLVRSHTHTDNCDHTRHAHVLEHTYGRRTYAQRPCGLLDEHAHTHTHTHTHTHMKRTLHKLLHTQAPTHIHVQCTYIRMHTRRSRLGSHTTPTASQGDWTGAQIPVSSSCHLPTAGRSCHTIHV